MNHSLLTSCTLCPRKCGVNRENGEIGFCKAGAKIKAARAALHYWEEPCLSGTSGSGTVFFSNCSMQCVFCQNRHISTEQFGVELTQEQLSDIFLSLQSQGALNINLVTPTHFVPQIITALSLARQNGLYLPVVYNTSGYETVETLQLLDGLVDIYLPDFKYWDNQYAIRYSAAPNYREYATAAVREMIKQVGLPRFHKNGIMRKGVIVRHLMLPGLLEDTKQIMKHLWETFHDQIYISLMSQYTPSDTLTEHYPELCRTVSEKEYQEAISYLLSLGVTQGFTQEGEAASESFIPPFNLTGMPALEESKSIRYNKNSTQGK
jgi:putative pyruvate formate lyase activating enzyme